MRTPRTYQMGRTKTQALALVSARSGKLFQVSGQLVIRNEGRATPVRLFSKVAIDQCDRAGWLCFIPQSDGSLRILTSPAGDAELARPLRLRKPASSWSDERREALR